MGRYHFGYHDYPLTGEDCSVCQERDDRIGEEEAIAAAEATQLEGEARVVRSPFDGRVIAIEDECPECGTTVKADLGINAFGFYYPKSVSCEHVDYVVTFGWGGGGRFVWKAVS